MRSRHDYGNVPNLEEVGGDGSGHGPGAAARRHSSSLPGGVPKPVSVNHLVGGSKAPDRFSTSLFSSELVVENHLVSLSRLALAKPAHGDEENKIEYSGNGLEHGDKYETRQLTGHRSSKARTSSVSKPRRTKSSHTTTTTDATTTRPVEVENAKVPDRFSTSLFTSHVLDDLAACPVQVDVNRTNTECLDEWNAQLKANDHDASDRSAVLRTSPPRSKSQTLVTPQPLEGVSWSGGAAQFSPTGIPVAERSTTTEKVLKRRSPPPADHSPKTSHQTESVANSARSGQGSGRENVEESGDSNNGTTCTSKTRSNSSGAQRRTSSIRGHTPQRKSRRAVSGRSSFVSMPDESNDNHNDDDEIDNPRRSRRVVSGRSSFVAMNDDERGGDDDHAENDDDEGMSDRESKPGDRTHSQQIHLASALSRIVLNRSNRTKLLEEVRLHSERALVIDKSSNDSGATSASAVPRKFKLVKVSKSLTSGTTNNCSPTTARSNRRTSKSPGVSPDHKGLRSPGPSTSLRHSGHGSGSQKSPKASSELDRATYHNPRSCTVTSARPPDSGRRPHSSLLARASLDCGSMHELSSASAHGPLRRSLRDTLTSPQRRSTHHSNGTIFGVKLSRKVAEVVAESNAEVEHPLVWKTLDDSSESDSEHCFDMKTSLIT